MEVQRWELTLVYVPNVVRWAKRIYALDDALERVTEKRSGLEGQIKSPEEIVKTK